MGKETIMLAKNLNLKKMEYPCVASEKLDGVPGDFFGLPDGSVGVRTRQDEPILSVSHIQEWLYGLLPVGHHLIGELHIEGKTFKDISGIVRRHETCPDLILNIFDYYIEDKPWMTYADRMRECAFGDVGRFVYDSHDNDSIVRFIEGTNISNEKQLLKHIESFTRDRPDAEGIIFRPLTGENSLYESAKRSWGFQRHKGEATADLRLVGFEEAIDKKTGLGNGMVGRLIVEYKGKHIGAGPGKLKHDERIDMFKNPKDYLQRIVQIAYKPDESYDALREARFDEWRDDKTEPNTA